jgi:MOSC domain-containing protein YiiM
VKEAGLPRTAHSPYASSFLSCVATVLELPLERLPELPAGDDPATGWTLSRWLGGLGLGLARVADPTTFSWPGPWIARVRHPDGDSSRAVVMFGVPSGVVWDPAGDGAVEVEAGTIEAGFLIAAADVALALPPAPAAPTAVGVVEKICVAAAAGERTHAPETVRALAGRGLDGDRHTTGKGTFPSGPPGSALTLIEAEVIESFEPALRSDEHRRNIVTRGIDLNRLVGREFTIGALRCRGMRLCEPCTVMQRYAGRPVLRALVHRGGLRADILADGEIAVGDPVRANWADR